MSVDSRLAALTTSRSLSFAAQQQPAVRDLEALHEMETLNRSMSAPRLGLASSFSESSTPSPSSGAASSPASIDGRVRALEAQVRKLKIQLAEEQMRNATVVEELHNVRGELSKSNDVLVTFAQRARQDRERVLSEETASNGGRKRLARSEPSGGTVK